MSNPNLESTAEPEPEAEAEPAHKAEAEPALHAEPGAQVVVAERVSESRPASAGRGHAPSRIGALLAQARGLSPEQLERVFDEHLRHRQWFGEAAVALGLVSDEDVAAALQAQRAQYEVIDAGSDASRSALVMLGDPQGRAAEAIREIRTALLAGAWAADSPEPAPGRGATATPVSTRAVLDGLAVVGPRESRRALAVIGARRFEPAHRPVRRALAIVSRRGADGRSHIAANLAVSLAQMGARVLLIDADLRHPGQHSLFGLSSLGGGLAGLLGGRSNADMVCPLAAVPSLVLMPAGTHTDQPGELLQQPRFAALLDDLTHRFDYVLLDTPAAERGADWQIVAMAAGLAALVVRAGVSRVDGLQGMVRQLMSARVEMAGVVVNG